MNSLIDRMAFWLADNYSLKQLVRTFGTVCFFAGLLIGIMLEKWL